MARLACSNEVKLRFDTAQSKISLVNNKKYDQDAAIDFLVDFYEKHQIIPGSQILILNPPSGWDYEDLKQKFAQILKTRIEFSNFEQSVKDILDEFIAELPSGILNHKSDGDYKFTRV